MVSLEHYLDTSYSPDREYVGGHVVERSVGERPHSLVLGNLIRALHPFHVFPALRVRTGATRCRVPDVCVTLEDPGEDILTTPPFICAEILQHESPTDLLEKLDEYKAMAVPHIWVIDPRARQAFTYDGSALQRIAGATLTAGDISIPLDEVFYRL